MDRSTNFGIGLTLMFLGLSVYLWLYSMDPSDNPPVAMLAAGFLFCPGAILLGRAFWPQTIENR